MTTTPATKINVKARKAHMNTTISMAIIVAAAMRLIGHRVMLASVAVAHVRRSSMPETRIEAVRAVTGRTMPTIVALAGVVLMRGTVAGVMTTV